LAGLSLPVNLADSVRREFWRISAKTSLGRHCIHDRHTRLMILAIASMSVALAITAVAPLWMLLLAPILLGAPHIVGDIRYLLVRPPIALRRWFVALLLIPLLAQTALRVSVMFDMPRHALAEVSFGVAAVMLGVVAAPGRLWRRLVTGAAVAAIGSAALYWPRESGLALAHLHNFIAVGIWLLFAVRAGGGFKAALASLFFLACCLAIMAGVLDGITASFAGWAAPVWGFEAEGWAMALAPGLPDAMALRVVQTYIFAQAMHYTVWLRLMPQELHETAPPTTFVQDLKSLRSDFGVTGLLLIVVGVLAVPAYAFVDFSGAWPALSLENASMANWGYLTIVLFHGWLELAFLSYFSVSGARPAP